MDVEQGYEQEILQAMEQMRIVDHHEHLRDPFLRELPYEVDLPYYLALNGYLGGEVCGSGLDWRLWPPDAWVAPPSGRFAYLNKPCARDESVQRWQEIKQGLAQVNNTITYRYIMLALRELYGFADEELTDDNWQALSSKIRAKSRNHPQWAVETLDKMKVTKVILDFCEARYNDNLIQDERLAQTVRMDMFVHGSLETVESLARREIKSIDDYLLALNEHFESVVAAGVVAIKGGGPYGRPPYARVDKRVAARIFDTLRTKGPTGLSYEEMTPFRHYMLDRVCDHCAEYGLPFQIHVGPHGWMGPYPQWTPFTNPVNLSDLFQKHLQVTFDIFHGGYPFYRELGWLARTLPNVYADACWLHFLAPEVFRQALSEWVETVPANKIFAWGGDHWMPVDHSFATLLLGKKLVAQTMAGKVASGSLRMKTALEVTAKIMGENALRVYSLG